MNISTLSLQYFPANISAIKDGAQYDPTGDTVQFAFAAPGATPSAWTAGEWEEGGDGIFYVAKVLVGPGALVLAAGSYQAWVKISDNPETPVLKAGTLEVTAP